jgi:HD-GYP domain-containing protein (c-di-GMP phosphodiesterase class II)
VGKIATERGVLKKVGDLTERERNHVMEHPKVSHRILSKVKFPDPGIALYALYHHEWYDGSGYPFGKAGDEIPLGARIISLADAFDAMVANRPYRDGKDLEGAIGEIDLWSGKQFDPVVVSAFFQVVENELSGKVASPIVIPLVQNVGINRAVRACLKKHLSRSPRKSPGKSS